MLDDFILANRTEIIARSRARCAARTHLPSSPVDLDYGIPMFLDQLVDALRLRRANESLDNSEIDAAAGKHGHSLHQRGFTIAQVVHDYGDVCQVITDLALDNDAQPVGTEFQTLNLCLDDAIASAVTQFAQQNERVLRAAGNEHMGVLSHELRNLLNTAMLSYEMIKGGRVSASGSTSLVLERSLSGLHELIARSLADVRLDAGLEHLATIPVQALLEEIEIAALLQAGSRGQHLSVSRVDKDLTVEGDPQILGAAIANLLQNAFKFTPRGGRVSLTTRTTKTRVLFDIEDECGGLPPGKTEELFRPFEQRGADRSGIGIGLAVCRKAAVACRGELRVQDLPGKGCVFTIDLPRPPPSPKAAPTPGRSPSVPPKSKRPGSR